VNNRWKQWVLNYSQAKQMDLLRNIGFDSPSRQDLSYVLIGIVVVASLLGAAWTFWERYRQDPWLRLLHASMVKLRKAGLVLPDSAPPRRIAQMLELRASTPETRRLTDWLLRMEQWRYASSTSADTAARQLLGLRREFRQLPWPKRLA
ncbi:MAG: DUF3488 domain-containing protein, partial [Rhodoferax sp.]|nr:DUF3488 domain-containing protein [Rhodoferax sp.]